jgi:uncharacterized membrane protein YfcA
MGVEQLILAALILFVSSMIQAMIGFAFNLIAIPLLIWIGFSLAESVAMTSIPIFVQLSLNTWKLRRHIVWRDLPLPVVIRFITLPVGIALLYTINGLETATIKQVVGVILLGIILVQLFVHFKPREHFHILWDILAFGLSGMMLGMTGMGGPPVVGWLMAHDWEPKRIRGFVSFLFWISAPVQIALLYWKLGDHVTVAFGWGIAFLPLVIIATLIGIHIGNTFDRKRLKNAVIFFLFLTAVVSILSPYL